MLSRMSLRLHRCTLSKACTVSEIVAARRSLHSTCKYQSNALRSSHIFRLSAQKPLLGAAFIRHASTNDTKELETILHSIPDPPAIPVPPQAPEILNVFHGTAEVPIEALGLGGWTPPGMIESALEWMHIDCGLPWWGTIVVGTCIVRLVMFPLVIRTQRASARMSNCLPQIQQYQEQISEARRNANDYELMKYSQLLVTLMKEKNISPLKTMLIPIVQAPIFVSFFMALRAMANAPVPSMREGGLFWFTDLTLCDQYYLLPLITCGTMYLTIKLGVDGMRMATTQAGMAKYFIKAVPFITFPFIMHFPGTVLCYWVSTNFISLIQSGILRIPAVKEFFRIESLIEHNANKLPRQGKGFIGEAKEAWGNMKVVREVSDRGQMDHLQFERAGREPIPKTYKYDPTKQRPSITQIAAKRRD
ncbi:mitochondrial inner membrane protein OXA1L [Athalia rosae]|uniref:mitochondrial inner membrane protein OXA1L n=1 Tax=Athalia rosae TaxID=37344 RepID=UPI00203365A4|nr:mitochondrial inner membrane protein OXA1L [Athalia rosae]